MKKANRFGKWKRDGQCLQQSREETQLPEMDGVGEAANQKLPDLCIGTMKCSRIESAE